MTPTDFHLLPLPPRELTPQPYSQPDAIYGEFTEFRSGLRFYAETIERCLERHMPSSRAPPYCFCDVGSGAGRIVLSTSALWGEELWRACRGVELAPALAELADEVSRHPKPPEWKQLIRRKRRALTQYLSMGHWL